MSASHDDLTSAGRKHVRPLAIAFGLVLSFMFVEFAAGFLTGSLALISDAGHMATDALGLGMALAAILVADRASAGGSTTYGMYRLEILAALANAVLLVGVAVYVLVEAGMRLSDPQEIQGVPMLVVAVAGLVVNVVSMRLLASGARESLNVEGAYLEVLADLIGSFGVIAAAVITVLTDWPYADPIFAAVIGVFILPRAVRLGRRALRILVQAAPPELDMERLERDLKAVPGVVDVHDLHVWTLTSAMDVATVHLVVAEGSDPHPVLDGAGTLLRDRFGIAHATLQIEPDTHEGCAEISW